MSGGCIAASVSGQTVLELRTTIEREFAGGESHEYLFKLQAGQYAKLLMDQRSINVAVECYGPDGNQRFAADSHPIGDTEISELIADVSGDYRLRVTAPDKTAPLGRYNITLNDVETATDRHRSRIAAARAYAQAWVYTGQATNDFWRSVIAHLEEALPHWRAAGDLVEQARALSLIGIYYSQLGEKEKAFEYTARALPLAREAKSRRFEAWTLTNIGIMHNLFGDKRTALEYYSQSLPMMREVADLAGVATTLNAQGRALVESGQNREALDYLNEAAKAYRELQDRSKLAEAVNNIGIVHSNLGEQQRALESYQQCLALHREVSNAGGEAITLNNIGSVYSELGELQKALDSYTAALEINRRVDMPRGTGINLHNIAFVYGSLGDHRRALKFYQEASEIFRTINNKFSLGNTMNNIGATYGELGDWEAALKIQIEALAIRHSVGDRAGEAVTLTNIGKDYGKLGDRIRARENLERAVDILRESGRRDRLAAALRGLGAVHRSAGDSLLARGKLTEALAITRDIRDRKGEGDVLTELAKLERDRGNLSQARQRADEALTVLESIRFGVASPSLRASYVASARELYELKIEVLMRLHSQQPEKGFGAIALAASEQGRARSLLEMLGESGTEIRRGVDAALLTREHQLEQRISSKAALQTRLLSGKHTDAEAAVAERELNALTIELEQVQGRIRDTSPQYAALVQPKPLDLKGIQTNVLDEDTVLLEYVLGANKSFLWAVSRSTMDIFELPPRSEIESAAKRVYDLLTARNQKPSKETAVARATRLHHADAAYLAAAGTVSRMLLGPAAGRIGNKRLLIVGEGVLHYLPFSALPEPGTGVPMMVNHEIVMAPSASVVAILRQETAGRKPAPKSLAVFADPVFNADDGRIASLYKPVVRSASQDFMRLRFSRTEADDITRLAGDGETLKALDFEASRDTAMKPELGEYRIVHFATHSLLNNEHPELSGVVLSLVDRKGQQQNGFLRLYDIYNLRLGAELVVLSACQTALGEEIKGEGLIGLTRGFLYAGAPRVVATLWEIDDRTTAEAMKRFYEGMLSRGERPAQALRTAQLALWKSKGWDAPYYWAAFTLQGEWR
jgi:CHAT domain-containing protein/tetratricopeptide (TPR) repeat protein